MSTCRVTKKGPSLSPDRISVYACCVSLTAEEEVGTKYEALGFFKNTYRNVRKAYFDRRTTQREFCFETRIIFNRRSV